MKYLIIAIIGLILIMLYFTVQVSVNNDKAEEEIKSLQSTIDSFPVSYRAVLSLSDTIQATVYGYSSTIDQTDSTPFITANGSRVRKGTLANNCLPFGTKVIIQGEVNTFTVEDRMNSRYGCNVFDIWFESRGEALTFGKQLLALKVYD